MWPQMRIEAIAQPARHERLGNIAMRDLRQRMHAGVGAARAINANLLAANRLDRVLQRALHRSAIVLDLPAAERRAVIFDDEFVAGHVDPVRPSSSAKADDPVFRGVSVQSQTARRTGYLACAGYDRGVRDMKIMLVAHPPSPACRAKIPPPSSAACRHAAVRETVLRLAGRRPRDDRRALRQVRPSLRPSR